MAGYYHTGLAKSALISGFLSLCLAPITAMPGIIMGHMARSRIKNFPHQYGGSGMALTGLFLNYFFLAGFIFLAVSTYYLQANGQLEPVLNLIDPSEYLSGMAKNVFSQSIVK